jgi:rare lipoprotein A
VMSRSNNWNGKCRVKRIEKTKYWFLSGFLLVSACSTQIPPANKSYEPTEDKSYGVESSPLNVQIGGASWYGPGFNGKKTASGDLFDESKFTAAHKTIPLGSKARVTHLGNGRSVEVLINDRGPYAPGRLIDLSQAAAKALGILENGIAKVRVELLPVGSQTSNQQKSN